MERVGQSGQTNQAHRHRIPIPQIPPTTMVLFCRRKARKENANTSMMLVTKYVRHKSVMRSLAIAMTEELSDKRRSMGSANKTNVVPRKMLTAVA